MPNTPTPAQNLRVITKIAREARQANGHSTDFDLAETIKALCAQHHVAYDSTVVGKAIDSSRVQARKARR